MRKSGQYFVSVIEEGESASDIGRNRMVDSDGLERGLLWGDDAIRCTDVSNALKYLLISQVSQFGIEGCQIILFWERRIAI